MATHDMSDLFAEGGSLITVRLSPRARERHDHALWYAWGRQDAGDDATKGKRSGHYLDDAFAFAEHAALEAEAFEREHAYSLSPISVQYERFVSALPAA